MLICAIRGLTQLITGRSTTAMSPITAKSLKLFHKMSLNSIGMLEIRYERHEDCADILAMPVPINGR